MLVWICVLVWMYVFALDVSVFVQFSTPACQLTGEELGRGLDAQPSTGPRRSHRAHVKATGPM